MSIYKSFNQLDFFVITFMRRYGIRILRISLAVVFIWFGALKIVGVTPVYELVARTVHWFSPEWFVPALGWWEIVIGVGLLTNRAIRFVLFLFWLQLAGTFLVLILRPDIAFQNNNPLLLTTEGEFVIKNLVLIAAGLVIGSTVERKRV